MLQENDDAELKGACGFTPHPELKVCSTRTNVCGKLRCLSGIINTNQLWFQDHDGLDELKGMSSYTPQELKVEEPSTCRCMSLISHICSLNIFYMSVSRKTHYREPDAVIHQTISRFKLNHILFLLIFREIVIAYMNCLFFQSSYSNGFMGPSSWDSKVGHLIRSNTQDLIQKPKTSITSFV